MDDIYDLIIIGAGPAGITAAVYAARKRMSFLIVTEDIGGQAAWSGDIENYTGYQFITGPELAAKFEEHLRKHKFDMREGEKVIDLAKENDLIRVKTNKGEYAAKAALVSSGKRSRELGVPGEKEFKNRGLTYCATCDGPLFSGKDIAVIGGGNSALDAVLQMINIASHVYVINAAAELTGDKIMIEKAEQSEKVTIYNSSRVTEVAGDKLVNTMRIERDNKSEAIPVKGVFVEVGLMPNSEFAGILERNESGEIKVNCRNETNIEGIFAAGDVTDVPEKQIIIAAGEGSKALLSAFRYLSRRK